MHGSCQVSKIVHDCEITSNSIAVADQDRSVTNIVTALVVADRYIEEPLLPESIHSFCIISQDRDGQRFPSAPGRSRRAMNPVGIELKNKTSQKDKRRKPHCQPIIDNAQPDAGKDIDRTNQTLSHSIPCCCLRRSRFSCLSVRSSFERTIFSGW